LNSEKKLINSNFILKGEKEKLTHLWPGHALKAAGV
jgi:hypothetical protein